MRLGLVSPLWPPAGGGGEVYLQRLGEALAARGFEVSAWVGTAAPEDTPGVVRAGPPAPLDPDDPSALPVVLPSLAAWFAAHAPEVVLVNAPWTRVSHGHAAAVYALARDRGCRIGAVHLDLDRGLVEALAAEYALHGTWEAAAEAGQTRLRALADQLGPAVYAEIGSPFHFDADFVLACSDWSAAFIDPLERFPRRVVHPPMGDAMAGPATEPLAPVDFGFVNPRPHKGGRTLAEIVVAAPGSWRFRALEGGHGAAFAEFRRAVAPAVAHVELCARIRDMRGFYDSLGALLVASLYEGYGMVAVEAMLRDVPVVARDYPAIREAVGDGAALVPFASGTSAWIARMREVREDPARWRAAAAMRTQELRQRETRELDSLAAFLRHPTSRP